MISIIVPVYKVEKYLPKCIDSILTQSYSDFELVLVDDGSPDGSSAICDVYARKDPRIRVIHKSNGGVSSARNAGLEIATGEYVTFCDSDDYYTCNWLEDLLEAAQSQKADVVVGNFQIAYENDTLGSVSNRETGVFVLPTEESRIRYCIDKLFGDKHGWEIWARLFRRSIIADNNIRFCETCGNFAEDLGFVLEYTLYAERIVVIPEVGYRYLIRGGSMMQTSEGKVKLNSVNEVSMQVISALGRAFTPEMVTITAPILHFLIMDNQYRNICNRIAYRQILTYFGEIQKREEWRNYSRNLLYIKKHVWKFLGIANALFALSSTYNCLYQHWCLFVIANRVRLMWTKLKWSLRRRLEKRNICRR